MKLKGLLNSVNIDSAKKKAVLVYLHGGFALGYRDLTQTQIFTDNDMIVFAPSYRGENGNPGSSELFMGEVRDTKSAINWISKQPFVDQNRIYVFGWSVGGGIALNLALHDDLPIRHQGSSAGIYHLDLIKDWATEDDYIKFPFDYKDSLENHFRLPIYHLNDMVRPHSTYIGKEDNAELYMNILDSLLAGKQSLLTTNILEGGHVSSLERAMTNFLAEIESIENQ
jgi:acetyl esterase/lipase